MTRHRLDPRRVRYDVVGLWLGTVLAFLSFTPSLLPRGWVYQGVVAGASAAFGYGVAVGLAALGRELASRERRTTSQRTWRIYLAFLAVGTPVALVAGVVWNRQSSALIGVDPVNPVLVVLTPVVALVVFAALVGLGRALRGLYRRTAAWLERLTSPRAARAPSASRG